MGIRLLVADDQHIVRAAIATMLSGTEIEVACQATNCAEAVRYAVTVNPDVVLLDLEMPDGSGLEALKKIKGQKPDVPVVIFSVHDGLYEMAYARSLGANGFVQKGESRESLLNAIRRVAAGKEAWRRPQLRRICRVDTDKQWALDENPLTRREMDVLRKIAEGVVNEDIAKELNVHLETVKHHIKSILQKLGVRDRTAAALWALRKGLL